MGASANELSTSMSRGKFGHTLWGRTSELFLRSNLFKSIQFSLFINIQKYGFNFAYDYRYELQRQYFKDSS